MDDTTRPVIYTSTEDFLVRFLHQIGPFVSAITTVPGHDVQAIEEELRDAVNPARDDPDPCIQLAVALVDTLRFFIGAHNVAPLDQKPN